MTDLSDINVTGIIALVGMMGVGKTTVGRRLASRLGLPFVDSDHEIEAASGRTIMGYFRDHGEPEFRKGERRVIRRLLDGTPKVLATGGGAFIEPRTRKVLMSKSTTIWLRASTDILFERVSRKKTRPLLATDNPRSTLEKLVEDRYPIYATAHITVSSETGSHMRTVESILDALKTRQDGANV